MIAAIVLGAFLAGSIPFGYLIARFFYRVDIRAHGSGNIGAMNALRTVGTPAAIAVLLLDALKGLAPPLIVTLTLREPLWAAIAAAAAVLGHCFSPFLEWKGGKGVATSYGATFALAWPAGIVAVAGWLLGACSTTYSSVGSLLGSVIAVPALWFFTHNAWCAAYGAFAAALIFFMHRDNIARLRAGRESGIAFLQRRKSKLSKG